MKILFNSIHLFFFSLYVDFYKYRFDCAVKKRLRTEKIFPQRNLRKCPINAIICLAVLSKKKKRLRLENDQSIKNALVF